MSLGFVDTIVKGLNPEQLQAVTAELSNMLIIAGAGTGKTTVLVRRLAYLILKYNIPSHNILAVTFTNKAAREMSQRIHDFVGEQNTRYLWCCTFHGACCKLLRNFANQAGLKPNFKIMDTSEQVRIVKDCFEELKIEKTKECSPKQYAAYISELKDKGLRPHHDFGGLNGIYRLDDVYALYQDKCNKANVLDFSELILRSVELMKGNPDVRKFLNGKFKQILVDEFQDTNSIQYEWLKLISGENSNVLIVGDDDQSIYGWRGAVMDILNRFYNDYPHVTMYKLIRNYRSTSAILANANRLIGFNSRRFAEKNLVTERSDTNKVRVIQTNSPDKEAEIIAQLIKKYKVAYHYKNSDFAVLYRTNMQSRAIESAFVNAGLPHRIIGGLRFYDREEIKNTLSYLSLITDHDDDVSLERIINIPSRKIGKVTLSKIKTVASQQGVSLFDACVLFCNANKKSSGIKSFVDFIQKAGKEFNDKCADYGIGDQVMNLLVESGLIEYYRQKDVDENHDELNRSNNIRELVDVISKLDVGDFDPNMDFPDEDMDDNARVSVQDGDGAESSLNVNVDNNGHAVGTLSPVEMIRGFVTTVAMNGDNDLGNVRADDESGDTGVNLMTIHSAKGLEFPCVIVAGFEDGLLPHGINRYSIGDRKNLDEERRLAYVAITRAKNNLVLTFADMRMSFGNFYSGGASMFFDELDKDYLEYYVYNSRG